MTLLPALLALGAAACFALGIHFQRSGLDFGSGRSGSMITVVSMGFCYWVLAPFLIEWHWWGTHAALLFAACGLVVPVAAQHLQVKAVGHLGAAIAGSLSTFAPVFAAIPAVLFLGEQFNFQAGLGFALMLGGVAMIPFSQARLKRSFAIWALLLPIGASFLRGVIQPIVKSGYAEVPSPFFAMLAMATVSALVAMTLFGMTRQPEDNVSIGPGVYWFAISGVMVAIGNYLIMLAISIGDIVVASPFTSTVPLWTLVFGYFIFRREQLTRWHLLIAAVICFGSVLLITR